MIQSIVTTIGQSQRLIACGVEPKTADMCWRDTMTNQFLEVLTSEWTENLRNLNYSPSWSTSRLLSLLPKSIKYDNDTYAEVHRYGLLIYPFIDGWQVDYQYCEDDECHSLVCVYGRTPIEACVKAIEWLTKEGYKLNQIEE